MVASFRNSGEILELAGCNLMTIAPEFLPLKAKAPDIDNVEISEKNSGGL